MKSAMVGLGDVGIVATACVASDSHDVLEVDVDANKVDEICSTKLAVRHHYGRRSVGS